MLKGSEKQVAWAKRIRAEKLATWKQSDPLVFQKVEVQLKNELSASWWITYREKSLVDVLMYIQGGATAKSRAMPKASSASSLASSSSEKKIHSAAGVDGGITRYVSELMDTVTGKVVIDPECPF